MSENPESKFSIIKYFVSNILSTVKCYNAMPGFSMRVMEITLNMLQNREPFAQNPGIRS
jgi:hypothetical protein